MSFQNDYVVTLLGFLLTAYGHTCHFLPSRHNLSSIKRLFYIGSHPDSIILYWSLFWGYLFGIATFSAFPPFRNPSHVLSSPSDQQFQLSIPRLYFSAYRKAPHQTPFFAPCLSFQIQCVSSRVSSRLAGRRDAGSVNSHTIYSWLLCTLGPCLIYIKPWIFISYIFLFSPLQ